MLKPNDIFKTATGDVWYVDYVSPSGAYCIHLSGHSVPITTRKRQTKIINRHYRNSVFSLNSIVDLVDTNKLDQIQLKRRVAMARKESTVEPTETAEVGSAPAPAAEPVKRIAARYVRTEVAPTKELRGQAKETFEALVAANGTPLSGEELGALCVYPGSRQDKARVANYYLAQFKKQGLVAPVVTEVPATAAPAPAAETEAPATV